MARTVEAIATDAVLVVEFVGEPVHIGMLGHRLVEGRVKYPYLRRIWEYLRHSFDTEDVGWVVKRSKLCALMEHIYYLWGDTYALSKALCTVYEAVTDGVDLIEGLYEVLFFENVEDNLYAACVVRNVKVALDLLSFGVTEGDEGVVDPYALFVPRGQDLVVGELDEGELQGGAATVEDQDFHKVLYYMVRCELILSSP